MSTLKSIISRSRRNQARKGRIVRTIRDIGAVLALGYIAILLTAWACT